MPASRINIGVLWGFWRNWGGFCGYAKLLHDDEKLRMFLPANGFLLISLGFAVAVVAISMVAVVVAVAVVAIVAILCICFLRIFLRI